MGVAAAGVVVGVGGRVCVPQCCPLQGKSRDLAAWPCHLPSSPLQPWPLSRPSLTSQPRHRISLFPSPRADGAFRI